MCGESIRDMVERIESGAGGLDVVNEMFWAGYLKALFKQGAITAETPAEDIWKMKAEFMAGIRGEKCTCEVAIE